MEHDRRESDERIGEIRRDVKDILSTLQGEEGVLVRLSVCERSGEATQRELEDHKQSDKDNKSNNFRLIDIILAIGVFFLGLMQYIGMKR